MTTHLRWTSLNATVIALLVFLVGVRDADAEPAKVDHFRNVAQFVGRHCSACHGETKAKGDVHLHGLADEAAVLRDLNLWRKVLRVVQAKEMPPEDHPQPADDERKQFAESLQSLLDQFRSSDPGRVRVRRLNRVEYNNTIRDLVGVEGDFAKDFPSDEVGHGFDNIGDVQSLSSTHLERYLAAAHAIMTRAIVVDPPARPPVRRVAAQQLGPTGPFIKPQAFRPLTKESGPLFTPFFLNQNFEAIPLHPEQQYRLRIRVHAKAAAGESVRIALLAYGKSLNVANESPDGTQLVGAGLAKLRPVTVLQTFDVKATTEDTAETFDAVITGLSGVQGGAVAIIQDAKETKTGAAAVGFLELEGPLDPRPPAQRRLLACAADKPQLEQTREVLSRFASRAYRRPVDNAELERLVQLVQESQARGEKWEAGIQLAMQAVLASPKFLYRLELDEPRLDHPVPATSPSLKPAANGSPGHLQTGHARPLDEYQLASRLSYFLWSTMPDDELFELAGKGQLTGNLEAQVRRMLQAPQARALVDNFVIQWLQLRRLETVVPDAKLFPAFDEKLRRAMLQETTLFFEAILREDRSVLDVIDADFTFLNERLAKHYRIADTNGNFSDREPTKPRGQPLVGDRFQRVQLQERGGVLTQASVLTVTSSPTRTSPVKRGQWILEQLLASPPPPPPANVPPLTEDAKAVSSGSLRQRLEQHRSNAVCANCHARMDPLGFALENFDAIGIYRTHDGSFPIDASGILPSGESFRGATELKALLKKKKDEFTRCLIEKMAIYALGRGLTANDQPTIDRINKELADRDYKFSSLVTMIVASEPFRMRSGDPNQ